MKGHIRQRSKGSWSVILSWREAGKFKQKWYTAHGPKREAQKLLAQKLADFNAGIRAEEPARLTVSEYLDRWLEEVARPNVRPTTFATYEATIRNHVIPEIGSLPLTRLTPARIQKFYADKLAGPRADGKPGKLSRRSVQYIHSVLRIALGQAVRWNLVARNVIDLVTPPRVDKKKIEPMTIDQVKYLLETARGDRLYALYYLALVTGLRRGELLGLKWSDLDLGIGILRVSRSLVDLRGRPTLQEPKTAKSRRVIELPPAAIKVLQDHRAEQDNEKTFWDIDYQDGGFIFTGLAGRPMNPRYLDLKFKALLTRAGLPDFRFHDLRHTFATLVIPGAGLKLASEILGHENISTTANIYGHVLDGATRKAISDVVSAITPEER